MSTQYIGSVEYTAVAAWAALTTYGAGAIVRQLATPAVGSERCFRTTAGGVSGAAEPTWTITNGGSTASDGTVTWVEVTGNATYNWSAPHARVANALVANWGAAGNTFYVSEDHAETQSTAISWTFPGTTSAPNLLQCVNHAGSVPPVGADARTTATATSTAASGNTFTTNGYVQVYGVGVTYGNGAGAASANFISANPARQKWLSCSFTFGATGAGFINVGLSTAGFSDCLLELVNTPINFSGTGQAFKILYASFRWRSTPTAIGVTAVPTNLIVAGGQIGNGYYILDGLDLSALNTTIVASIGGAGTAEIINCQLNASVTPSPTPVNAARFKTFLVSSGSASNSARQEIYDYMATLTTELTNVRSGGASDGTTPISWKVVSNANANRTFPFDCFDIFVWAANTGVSQTVTIPIMSGNTLLNSDIWVDAFYLGSGSVPLASVATNGPANPITAGSNLATDGVSSWTTTGVGSPVLQSLTATFTVNMAGYVRLRIRVAKASQTLWIDPKAQGVT